MKQYSVYISPLGPCEAVKQGWSWPAFFFGPFWAFGKGLWHIGTAVALVICMEAYFQLWGLASLINWAFPLIFGARGNRWREWRLLRRGYEFKAAVRHSTAEGAMASYVGNQGKHAGTNG